MFNKQVRRPTLLLHISARPVILQDRIIQRAIAVQRFDDTPDAIVNRVKTFYTKINGAISPNKAVTRVLDGEQTAAEVYIDACKIIDEVIEKILLRRQLSPQQSPL